ncbi:MAG: RagB/SusD family nutrient uptake outer membrane protein [Mariniphaga sp.]|nr:RagB/SusD family nutrient uptake outer membrane protein [Mariniphaga sp.]
MKRIKYIFLCFGLILLIAACKNFLETTPKDGTVSDATFFKTTADFDAFIFGAYADMAGGFDGSGIANWVKVQSFISQEATGPDEIRKPLAQYMSATNDQITAFWKTFYSISAKSNQVLAKLKDAKIPEADKSRLQGEALFFRGFAYFNLGRAYGKVPLITKPYDASQNFMNCTPEDSIWIQVIADLTAAAPLLKTRAQLGSDQLGRVTKGTAYAYLANAYMYKKDWTNAETASNSLIALGEYNLMATVRSVFSELTENNVESILEVQYRDVADGKVNWSGHEVGGVLPEYTSPRNIGAEYAPAGGWGEIVGTRKLADSFEPGDDRRKELIKVPGEKYKGENMKEEITIPLTIAQTKSSFSTKYWLGPSPDLSISYLFKQNNPVMRYAEFLLNYSEILFMKGKTTEGYAQMNKVRNRAKLPSLVASADQAIFMKALMNERRHELNFEPNLWFHYTRTKTAASFLLEEYGVTMNPAWYKFPVPQSERDQNQNLCQNEGY